MPSKSQFILLYTMYTYMYISDFKKNKFKFISSIDLGTINGIFTQFL